jgi:dihydrofolate reductase
MHISTDMRVVLIAAVARNGVIGDGRGMPWRLPEDLAHFRRRTLGHPVIMGRVTWDSLTPGLRPLPGRRNLVLSRDPAWAATGAERVASLAAALALVDGAEMVFVIGGAQIYREALPQADTLLLTEIDRDADGSTHFPAWPRADFIEIAREHHQAAAPNDFAFDFVTYHRKS